MIKHMQGFWKKKQSSSQENVEPKSKISDIDIYQQINNSLPKISFHIEHFFNDHLKFEDLKIEFNSHQLIISCKPNAKCITYLMEKSCEYNYNISTRSQTRNVFIDVEFNDLYKFFGIYIIK